MFIFNKNISFLRPRSVLSAVCPPPPLFFSVFLWLPAPHHPSHLESDGTVQPRTDQCSVDRPTLKILRGGDEGVFSGVTEQKRKHCVVRQSTSFLLALSLISWFRQGQNISTTLLETSDSVSVCRRVCNVYSFTWRLHMCVKSSAERDVGYRKTDCCCYLLYHTHTRTHPHNCISVPQCFPAPSNQHRPAVPQWAELRWSQPVSVSVCIWILYFIISLQTASSLILLTIIIRMVSVS